jgi:predicted peptidase
MGGYDTWALLARSPSRFAAAAPISGGGDPALAPTYAHVPIRVLHGTADEVVPLSQSSEMVDALKAAGADVALTVYPGVGHDS